MNKEPHVYIFVFEETPSEDGLLAGPTEKSMSKNGYRPFNVHMERNFSQNASDRQNL